MINFKKIVGPAGIPIYYQQMPEIVESVALDWLIFTGSADDAEAGAEGAYHWFEHVPFRGTKQFPNGYADTKGQFTRFGGMSGAWTNTYNTDFWAHVPIDQFEKALEVITDLWSQPLARDQDIEAERTIILEEIRKKISTAQGKAQYLLGNILWPQHPFGHPTLGSVGSLNSITPEVLRIAYKNGYDLSRATLFVSGNIPLEKVVTSLEKLIERMPKGNASGRSEIPSYGALPPWQEGQKTVIETEFSSTVLVMLFETEQNATPRQRILWQFLGNLLSQGGLDSPLYRIVREERKLAYNTTVAQRQTKDGGFWGLQIETGSQNIDASIQAFQDVLQDKELRSQERIDEIKQALAYGLKMRAISPHEFNKQAIYRMQNIGVVMNDEERLSIIQSFTKEEVSAVLDKLTLEKAHIVIFKGTDNK